MPRYFFNLVLGKVVVYDRTGQELDDARAARLFALHSVREMIAHSRKKKPLKPSECSIDVCDGSGNVLFVVPFAEARERL